MIGDVLGMGRSSILEGFMGGSVDPEIEAITLESVSEIPDIADPASYAMQLAYACEMNMANMNIDIFAEEYSYLRENGDEMIWEAGGLSNIVRRFREWVKKLWEKITSFFKSLFSKIQGQTTSVKKMLEVYKDAGTKSTSVDVTTIVPSDTTSKNISDKAAKLIGSIHSQVAAKYERVDDFKRVSSEDQAKKDEKGLDEFLKKQSREWIGKDDFTQSNVGEHIGIKSKDKISMTGTAAYASMKEYVGAEGQFKAVYAKNKGAVDAMIKAAKSLEDMVSTQSNMAGISTSDKETAKGRDRYIHHSISVMTKFGSWMNIVNSAAVAGLNACLSRDKYVLAHIKSGRAEKTNESFMMI